MQWPQRHRQRLQNVGLLLVRGSVHLVFYTSFHKVGNLTFHAWPIIPLWYHHYGGFFSSMAGNWIYHVLLSKPIALICFVAHIANFAYIWAIRPTIWPLWAPYPCKARLEAFVLWGCWYTPPLSYVASFLCLYKLASRFVLCSLFGTPPVYLTCLAPHCHDMVCGSNSHS